MFHYGLMTGVHLGFSGQELYKTNDLRNGFHIIKNHGNVVLHINICKFG